MSILIFVIVLILQYILTLGYFVETCSRCTLYVWLLYITHHILDVFLFWSFLFLRRRIEYIYHLIFLVFVVIHWKSYDNKCILTVMMNRECGYEESKWLDSLKNKLSLEKINKDFHYVWMYILGIYDLYKIIF